MKEKVDEMVVLFLNSIGEHIGGFIGKFLKELLITVIEISGDVCLIVGLIALILYIFGYKKGNHIPLLSWGISILIKIIGEVILSV